MVAHSGSAGLIVNTWGLVKQVSNIPVWEFGSPHFVKPQCVKIGRMRRRERRRKEIARLSKNIRLAIVECLVHAGKSKPA